MTQDLYTANDVKNIKEQLYKEQQGKYDSPKESFVYSFLIENQHGVFVKIGKSNNPYLRHLGFQSGVLTNNYTFLGAVKFKNEKDAYRFERQLHRQFKDYRLDKNFTSTFMDSGFTEVFSTEVLTFLPNDLKGVKDGEKPVHTR